MKRKKGLPTYQGSRIVYIALGGLSILEVVAIIAQAIFLARAITFLFQGATISTVVRDIVFFGIAFLSKYCFTMSQQYVAERFAERVGKELRQQLLITYFKNGHGFTKNYGTGRLVTLTIEGISHFKKYIEIAIPRMIRTMIIPFLIVGYVLTLDRASAIILIVTVPIVIVFMILLGIAAQKMADRQYETYRILSNHFIDSLKGLETLKYLGKSIKHERNIHRVSEQYRKTTMRTLRIAFLSSFALDFFTSLSIAFVAVGLGFRLIDGNIELLPALTILILAPEYFLPIRQVGKDYHATLDGQIAMEEINDIIKKREEPIVTDYTLQWTDSSTLRLEHISIQYDGEPVLKDVSLSQTGNHFIGIVGASGAGKSTFINVLAGFTKPSGGNIYLNGQQMETLHREDWLQNIAYIPQHPYIFPTTLANNIRFYEPKATDQSVLQVIEKIGLMPFVQELPNGIHERIGEGGRSLSGGQEQRIALARALLSQKPVLLLDEPTAHLDIETEYEMKEVMLNVFQNKLVFLATHRYHWMKEMDQLLVLKNGELVEQGSHDELRKQNGHYVQLIKWLKEGNK